MRSPDAHEPEGALSPRDIVKAGLCIGCGACVAQSGGRARMRFNAHGQLEPSGPRAWFAARTLDFARTCPFSPLADDEDALAGSLFPQAPLSDPRIGRHLAAYVGWAEEGGFRAAGSSGGLVTWTAAELLAGGHVDAVAHVAPGDDGALFRYRVSRSLAEVRAGAKSRYYPIELSGVIDEIRAVPGRYAVMGVPCFIKSIQLLRAQDPVLRERAAFTLALVCGHMKSARMVESFAWQMGLGGRDVAGVDFREKDPSRPANWYRARIDVRGGGERREDWWNLADGDWGAGFFQAPACDFCDDVVGETADASFGDAWVEPYASDGRGTNVVVVRSPVIRGLLEQAAQAGRISLQPVDADLVHATQAASFRQRREGLALRLAHRPARKLRPRKRVRPDRLRAHSRRRRAVYGMRRRTAAWSHRVFRLARAVRRPGLYVAWARVTLTSYQALTYSRGRLGRALDRLFGAPSD